MHRDRILRETVESVSARNSFMAIKDYLTFIHGFVGFFLNSALSMIVLSVLLPGHLFTGYIISLVISVTLILLLRGTVGRHSTRTEKAFIAYSESLSRIWDNCALGNHYNFNLWQSSRDRRARQYYRQSNRLQLLKQSGNLALATAALLPTIYLISKAIDRTTAEPTLVAAIIVNLTRVFHILSSLSALVYQLLDFSAMNSRLRLMFDTERRLSEPLDLPDTPCGEIVVNGAPVHDYDSVTMSVRSSLHGRFTVRGANGAGKSTLLQVLKRALADEAVLLPAQHGKLEWQHELKALSTGQKTLAQLQEISNHAGVKYLLLDEWDANLDSDNRRAISDMLDLLGQSKVIVEIRH
jgi:ABC-type bacteriocin/lantibiotic exporter with double-glycine peptidase domain